MKYLPQHCLKSYILVTYIMRQKQVKKLLKFFVIVCTTTGKQNKTASLIYLSFYLTKLTQFIRLSSLLLTLSGFSYDCEGRTLRRLNPLGFTAACHIILFGGKNSVLYKGCFKRSNAYLCRCLEVNTLPQVTKQPDYLS